MDYGQGEVISARAIALVWDNATWAAVRRRRFAGRAVSFGWHEYVGGEPDLILGEEGLDFAVADRTLRLASDMAQRWFIADGQALLTWRRIPVGAAAATDLFSYFQRYIKLAFVLDHIIARHTPARVVFADDGSPRAPLLASMLAARGVPFEVIGSARVARAAARLGLAARRAAWPAMFLAARRKAGGGRRRLPPAGPVFWGQFGRDEVAIYRGFRRAYGAEVPFFAATVAAARAARREGAGDGTLFDYVPSRRRVREIFRSLKKDYRALVRRGLLRQFDLPPGLAAFLIRNFPFRPGAYLISLAMTTAAVVAFFERFRPSLVVHLSDVHVTGRLATTAAAARGIPALVVQNHITGGPTFGYLPLSSTKMAAWGEVSRAWLAAGGAAAEKLVVVGSPYAAVAARRYGRRAAGPRAPASLLVASNNFDADQNRVVACAAAAYARERPGLKLVFRPHPAEPPGLYRAVIKRFGLRNATVARDRPLAELLAQAAVVVASHSGVGVDALIAGVPLVHVNLMKGVADYIPYVAYGAAAAVDDVAALAGVLDEVRAAPPARFAAGVRAFARAYLGRGAGDPFENIASLARELERR